MVRQMNGIDVELSGSLLKLGTYSMEVASELAGIPSEIPNDDKLELLVDTAFWHTLMILDFEFNTNRDYVLSGKHELIDVPKFIHNIKHLIASSIEAYNATKFGLYLEKLPIYWDMLFYLSEPTSILGFTDFLDAHGIYITKGNYGMEREEA